jgi:hypothetical protein
VGATAAAPTGFIGWITTYGSIIGFFVQIAFYTVVAASSAWAAVTFARYVKYMTSEDVEVVESGESVEEFVD